MKKHKHVSPADYKLFSPTRRDAMFRLKLEVDLACDYFWEKRGTTDPGAGGFRLFHLSFGRAA